GILGGLGWFCCGGMGGRGVAVGQLLLFGICQHGGEIVYGIGLVCHGGGLCGDVSEEGGGQLDEGLDIRGGGSVFESGVFLGGMEDRGNSIVILSTMALRTHTLSRKTVPLLFLAHYFLSRTEFIAEVNEANDLFALVFMESNEDSVEVPDHVAPILEEFADVFQNALPSG
nr:hypothetical protein [Tanacetum cinerariifolium]